ncbi:hypothetical protein [Phocaeicola sartorii]|jgi:hypothetical protein|uniref:Uncharacterized protein n=1 Tax=Phocaeicola sartorii TaxID=671267 RepID=R9I894_9BACT|nr:hypothetical protein [Phocaeicola sartorii]EOS09590.1 hypothetical protein C802_03703 [Phocaeicola sartorii]MCR1844711.1 hypothetical protein [Phocaeicola sartorii]NUL00036.1 hypothetical protein [Phocaeicola sartorii]
MESASFNIQLDYNQIRDIVGQLSDEDKLRLANELIAQTRKSKLEYFQGVFKGNEAVDELPSMGEIQEEVDAVRQELYEKRKRG